MNYKNDVIGRCLNFEAIASLRSQLVAMETKIYKDKQEVAKAFAEYFANLVKGKDSFHVALSGGSTPKTVFNVLVNILNAQLN